MFIRSSLTSPAPPPVGPGSVAGAPMATSPAANSRYVILVVDDSAMIRGAVVKALMAAGYQIVQAENGRAGLEMWEKHSDTINLVISDVFMPEIDGMSMARELRRR